MIKASKKTKICMMAGLFVIIPQIVFADGVTDLIRAAFDIVNNILIPLAFSLCLLYFFWGVVKYIRSGAESEKAAEEGKNIIMWGVIGLFVAVSIWGIIKFIQNELSLPGDIKTISTETN